MKSEEAGTMVQILCRLVGFLFYAQLALAAAIVALRFFGWHWQMGFYKPFEFPLP